MHGAQRKHIFFAGVRKRIGHMSMHDQSASLTLAFSLSAASRCLEEQQTDGARGDPPAGSQGSCTIWACCARLGACAPLRTPPPPGFEDWSSHGCSVAARRCSSPWPIDRRGRRCWSPCAQDTSSTTCACSCRRAQAAVGSSGSGGRRSRCSSCVAFAAHVCGITTGRRRARVALQLCCCFWHGGCSMYSVQRCACRCPGCTVRTCVAPLVCPCVCTSVIWQLL